ncbi:Uncharacterized protein Rs2_28909 [Raphanus sativus]|nr:Uncharacterized protein Rs2_28909 [Raphanus sativus]
MESPVITNVTVAAVCSSPDDSCSLAVYLTGFQQVAIGLGTMVLMPVIGNLSDRYGVKAVLTLPMCLSILPPDIQPLLCIRRLIWRSSQPLIPRRLASDRRSRHHCKGDYHTPCNPMDVSLEDHDSLDDHGNSYGSVETTLLQPQETTLFRGCSAYLGFASRDNSYGCWIGFPFENDTLSDHHHRIDCLVCKRHALVLLIADNA